MRDRQNPFESMEQFVDQMRREMFGVVGAPAFGARQSGDRWSATPAFEGGESSHWDAGISIEEAEDGFVVLADLPGFDREELTVRLHDDELRLGGEHEVEDGTSYRSRRVSERVALPAAPDPEHVRATYHNGVLEVRLVVESDDEASGIDIDIE